MSETHPETLTGRAMLGQLEAALGDPALGLEILNETLRLQSEMLGPEHRDARRTMEAIEKIENAAPPAP